VYMSYISFGFMYVYVYIYGIAHDCTFAEKYNDVCACAKV